MKLFDADKDFLNDLVGGIAEIKLTNGMTLHGYVMALVDEEDDNPKPGKEPRASIEIDDDELGSVLAYEDQLASIEIVETRSEYESRVKPEPEG